MRTIKLFSLVLLLSLAGAAPASAVRVAIGVTGTSTGSGMVDIIIQDNDGPNRVPDDRLALYEIDVTIPEGNTAAQSASAVANALIEELPKQVYKITIIQSTIVVIERVGKITNFQVADDVPGQTFESVTPPTIGRPAPMRGITLAVAAAGMVLAGAYRLRRRRR